MKLLSIIKEIYDNHNSSAILNSIEQPSTFRNEKAGIIDYVRKISTTLPDGVKAIEVLTSLSDDLPYTTKLKVLITLAKAKLLNFGVNDEKMTPEDVLRAYGNPKRVADKAEFSMNELQINNPVIKNKYVKRKDDTFYIDKNKALEYLQQFNNDEVDAEWFINDSEGLSESELNGLEEPEKMNNEEMEDFLRMEMSYYYFSDSDSINELQINNPVPEKINQPDYVWYVLDIKKNILITGWEYRSDAMDYVNDHDEDTRKNVKVIHKKTATSLGLNPDLNKSWGQ